MNETKTKPYYIFLNIDGTLWDAKYIYGKYGYLDLCNFEMPDLKKESIDAVNILLKSLENKYDTKLVITSSRRKDMESCTNYLIENGLEYNKPIFAIKYPTEISRGDDIVDFMKTRGEQPFNYSNKKYALSKFFSNIIGKDYKNYVVLEDEKAKIKGSIPRERTIIPNHNNRSVTKKQIDKYLTDNNIDIVLPETNKDYSPNE